VKKSFSRLVTVILLFSAVSVFGQLKDDSSLFTLNMGFAPVTNPDSENDVTAYGVNGTYEKFLSGSRLALGVNVGFMGGNDSYIKDTENRVVNLTTTSVNFTSKYLWGSGQTVPFIGLGIGLHWSYVSGTAAGVGVASNIDKSSSGISVNVPLGINFFLSEKTFIGFNVVGMFIESSQFEDDLNFALNLSVGFQM